MRRCVLVLRVLASGYELNIHQPHQDNMKTALRHLFNYWLPPGQSNSEPASNQLVNLAVKINTSCVAMLAGAEIDWDEMARQNAEWTRLTSHKIRREALTELTRLSEEMGGYESE